MEDWERPQIQDWAKGAEEMQQHLCSILGKRTWDIFHVSEKVYLQNKVGYALFGPPRKLDDENVAYTRKQLKIVGKVCRTIMKQTKHYTNKDRIPVAFIFIVTNISDDLLVPVIRMPKYDSSDNNSYLFIDSHCRVYKSWSHFLKTNKLSKCLMVCPKDGVYSEFGGKVQLDRVKSPGWFTKQTKQAMKTSETLISISFAGICLAALFNPLTIPTTPILVGIIAKSIATIGYTVHKLVDRRGHKQTLGLNSQEARGCWVGLASESLSTASGGISAAALLMTKTSHTAFLVGNAGLRALRITKATIDALGALNDFTGYATRVFDDEDVTIVDSIQMASSILFFSHAVIPLRVAAGIVKALKDAKLPTILCEVLQNTDQKAEAQEGEGKTITHIETAEEFVQIIASETHTTQVTEPDSPTVEKNFLFTERNKFIKNILISASRLETVF
ncbi:uncharacterized protein [Anabrus simplex]|uniref:uncharacterized protein isoform X1 n=1 Tax=Anabrus simplex TaxID=316456 RepID=UPI0035A33B42